MKTTLYFPPDHDVVGIKFDPTTRSVEIEHAFVAKLPTTVASVVCERDGKTTRGVLHVTPAGKYQLHMGAEAPEATDAGKNVLGATVAVGGRAADSGACDGAGAATGR